MRIGLDPAVTREMLAAGGHAGAVQAVDQRPGQLDDDRRVAWKERSPMTLLRPPVEVEHRRKRQVDAALRNSAART
jgi:hypothetical protein